MEGSAGTLSSAAHIQQVVFLPVVASDEGFLIRDDVAEAHAGVPGKRPGLATLPRRVTALAKRGSMVET